MRFKTIHSEKATERIKSSRPQNNLLREKYTNLYQTIVNAEPNTAVELNFESKAELKRVMASVASWQYRQTSFDPKSISLFRDYAGLRAWVIRKSEIRRRK